MRFQWFKSLFSKFSGVVWMGPYSCLYSFSKKRSCHPFAWFAVRDHLRRCTDKYGREINFFVVFFFLCVLRLNIVERHSKTSDILTLASWLKLWTSECVQIIYRFTKHILELSVSCVYHLEFRVPGMFLAFIQDYCKFITYVCRCLCKLCKLRFA